MPLPLPIQLPSLYPRPRLVLVDAVVIFIATVVVDIIKQDAIVYVIAFIVALICACRYRCSCRYLWDAIDITQVLDLSVRAPLFFGISIPYVSSL